MGGDFCGSDCAHKVIAQQKVTRRGSVTLNIYEETTKGRRCPIVPGRANRKVLEECIVMDRLATSFEAGA